MRFFSSILAGSLILGVALPAFAEPIGLVQKLQNTAYGTPPAAARAPKQPTDGVEFNELIETVTKSAIEIGFVDGSSMTIGADSSILIDEFVFDSDAATGHALLTLSKGAMRWVTGVMPPSGIRMETPTASIAIRGTTLLLGVRPGGQTILALVSGLATVTSRASGQTVDLVAGQSARVTAEGVEIVNDILSVADAVVDDGWRRAENFRSGRGRDSESSDSNSEGHSN